MRRVTSVATPVAHLVGPGKLKVVNGHLAFSARDQAAIRLDPGCLRQVLCYGPVGLTDEALDLLHSAHIPLAWMTAGGRRCRGRLAWTDAPRTALRLRQYAVASDPQAALAAARWLVGCKLDSQETAARHYQRHGCGPMAGILRRLRQARAACADATRIDVVRGLEGLGTGAWFAGLAELFVEPWRFPGRNRRPPTDPVNALLSLGYTWLMTRTLVRCECLGLEPYLGTLHAYHPGRPSLACDLMEPLRVPAVDRWVVGWCNSGDLGVDEFEWGEHGVRLLPDTFVRALGRWEDQWLNGGHEAALEQLLEEYTARLRAQPLGLAEVEAAEAPSAHPRSGVVEAAGAGQSRKGWPDRGLREDPG